MIGWVVTDLIEHSRRLLQAAGVNSIDGVRQHPTALIDYSEAARAQTQELKRFLRQYLYAHERVKQVSAKAGKTIRDLFSAFMDDPRLLPPQYQDRLPGPGSDAATRARIIADYIAGMTDRYAIREHARLLNSREWA
jgi:dGTPase